MDGSFAATSGQNDVRLSLAGAQAKLPVHVEGDQVLIPVGDTPSTCILKFASPHYAHLPENETFTTLLAKQLGLPAVDVRIRKTTKASISVISRYDRQFESGRWHRLHQEDFCQVLGIDASRKYEGAWNPDLVTAKHFAGLASDLGFQPKFVLEQAQQFSQRIDEALPISIEAYNNQFGQSPVLERLPILIGKQIRRLKSQLRSQWQ